MSALRAEQALRRAALEDALRAEAAESERRLCLQFAEEATAFKVQADISLQQSEAQSRAAVRREMTVLRRQLEGREGVIMVCGPPCAGKTLHAEVIAAQLGIPHAALPALLQDGAVVDDLDGEQLRGALLRGEALPPGALLRVLRRAASTADGGLLLLECPAHSSLLPSLLLRIRPLMILLIDAPDKVCTRRMQRRARASGQGVLPIAQVDAVLSAYRQTDERVARAFGKAHHGRLCVLDGRGSLDEAPAIFAEAIVQAVRTLPSGARMTADGPVLVVSPDGRLPLPAALAPLVHDSSAPAAASIEPGAKGASTTDLAVEAAPAMANAMASEWGGSHVATMSHDEALAQGGEVSALLMARMTEAHVQGKRYRSLPACP